MEEKVSSMRNNRVISLNGGSPQLSSGRAAPTVDETQNRLDELARAVRTIYCICYRTYTGNVDYGKGHMPAWDGGEDQFGRTCQPIWPKIARTIVSIGADPYSYVESQFSVMANKRRSTPPKPNQLCGDNAIQKWQEEQEAHREHIRNRVSSDLHQIKVHVLPFTKNLGWERERAYTYVLRDTSHNISPLVRYCVALVEALPIAESFREQAILQYMFQSSVYDELLADQIPQDLREEASMLKQGIGGR